MAKRRLKYLAQALIVAVFFIGLTGATCSEIYTSKGTWYRVQKGDSISRIAQRFGTTTQYVAEMNNITDSNQLVTGQRIYIPNDRRSYAKKKKSSKKSAAGKESRESSDKIIVQRGKFSWPVEGVLTSKYGMRRGRKHDGIDISAPKGTPVKAAGSGEVVFSSRLRGYGNLILVKHAGDYFTVYAHNSRNLKKKGQKVKKGDVIARVGTTGRASGPHVHFEVRKGSRARNPLFFLPKTKSRIAKGDRVGTGGS